MRAIGLAKKMYRTSPESLVSLLRSRLRNPIPPPETAERARVLDEVYYARRDLLIQKIVETVVEGENRGNIYKALQGFRAKEYDERVVEYPYFVDWLLCQAKGVDLLDVGCTLNNKIVSSVLKERCNSVWFCNIVIESTIFVQNPVYYHIFDLDRAFPNGEQFPLVTCLSTIEHIGYDNSQYGYSVPAKHTTPNVEPLIAALRKLAQLTSPGGSMLISVPYGCREALPHPSTGRIAFQVFDFASLKEAEESLRCERVNCEIDVLAVREGGWVSVDPETCDLRYADGVPAASAVALIKGTKAE